MPQASPPLPVAASLTLATGAFVVTFDQPLQPGVSAGANWRAFNLNLTWETAAPLSISGSAVSGTLSSSLGGPPGPTCRYFAVPPDVLSLDAGLPVAAFSGFPLTIL